MRFTFTPFVLIGFVLSTGLTRAADIPTEPPLAGVQLTVCLGLDWDALKLLNRWEQQHPNRPDHQGSERSLDVHWDLTNETNGQQVSGGLSALADCGLIYLNTPFMSNLTAGQWSGTFTMVDDHGTLLTGKLSGWDMLLFPNSGNNVRPVVLFVYQPPPVPKVVTPTTTPVVVRSRHHLH